MEAAIDKCTGSKKLDDDWALILQISESYAVSQSKQCLKLISRKIFQPNPHLSLKAITLLDGCMKNAGNKFARELSSRDFVNLFKSKYPKMHAAARTKILQLTKQWSDEYKNNTEFTLLATLYSWVQSEFPQHVLELENSQRNTNKEKQRSNAIAIQAKEEDDFAKAIALSLTDTGVRGGNGITAASNYTATPKTTPQSVYPQVATQSNTAQAVEQGKARALFDFEAAEDNELTFKTDDVIILLDTSDVNWWKGRSPRGEGLFPAQFVAKLEEKGEDSKENNTANAEDQTLPQATIDPFILTACLEMLNEADPTGLSHPDPPELPQLEARCKAMEPLIDRELQEVDQRISNMDELNTKLVDALAQFHDLVSRTPLGYSAYGVQKLPTQPPLGMRMQYVPVGYQMGNEMYQTPAGTYPHSSTPQLVYQQQLQPSVTTLPGNNSPVPQSQQPMYQAQQPVDESKETDEASPEVGPYLGAVPPMLYGPQPGVAYGVPGLGYPVGPRPTHMYEADASHITTAPGQIYPPGRNQSNSEYQHWRPLLAPQDPSNYASGDYSR